MTVMTTMALHIDPAEAADPVQTLLDHVAAHRDGYQRAGRLDDATMAHLQAAGVFRALVPRSLGGEEMDPVAFLRLIERIATVDGSAGWVASFGSWKLVAGALPPETYAALHADGPDGMLASSGFPFEPAIRVAGGYRIAGRRRFSSGVSGAPYIAIGITGEDGRDRLAVLSTAAVTVIPEWDVIGLRGTGSYDVMIEDAFVPDAWTFFRGSQPAAPFPLHAYPVMILSGQAMAAVALGAARAAIDALVEVADARGSLTGGPLLADRPHVQIALAEAEGAFRAARAGFYEAAADAAATVAAGQAVSTEQRLAMRLTMTHAASTAAKVARAAFEQAGSAGIAADHRLARTMQDATVVAQHALLGPGTWQNAGLGLLGREMPKGYP